MTRLSTLAYFIIVFPVLFSCKKETCGCGEDFVGNWIRRSDFDSMRRSGAVSFVIADSAYVGTGYDGQNRLNDLWRYDVTGNYWTQRASLPGAGRNAAVGFSTSTKGYIATGFNGLAGLKDTWEFDPTKNSWTKKADFAGTARMNAVAFGINDKGYIATGNDASDVNDCWMYDPSTDAWTQKTNTAMLPREAAVAFAYKNQAYIVTGINSGVTVNDFWMYDPGTDKWTAKRPITNVSADTYDDLYNIVRSNATAFVIGDYAYLCTGAANGSILKSVWQYNFVADTWLEKTDWEGVERADAVGFTVKGMGFLGLGKNSKYYFDDFREFKPFDTYNVND